MTVGERPYRTPRKPSASHIQCRTFEARSHRSHTNIGYSAESLARCCWSQWADDRIAWKGMIEWIGISFLIWVDATQVRGGVKALGGHGPERSVGAFSREAG